VRAGQGRFDEAIEQYRQADEKWQKKKPKDRKIALRYWADALCRQGYYEQAAAMCQDAIRVDPDDPWAYDYLGDVFAAQERFDDAIAQYRQADEKWQKKKSKRRKIALQDWARALHSQKHYEQAFEKFREAIRVDPDDPWAYDYLGDVFAAQERFDEAIEQYREANERWQKKESKDRKFALWNWGQAFASRSVSMKRSNGKMTRWGLISESPEQSPCSVTLATSWKSTTFPSS
jgi:tetratricopeptide (TPR) repeat protein